MKRIRILWSFVLLVIGLVLCSCGSNANSPSSGTGLQSDQGQVFARCKEIASVCLDAFQSAETVEAENRWSSPGISQAAIDEIESLLIDAGFDVIDSSGIYPSYLASGDRFCDFWEHIQQSEYAQQEILSVTNQGMLSYCRFTYVAGDGNALFDSAIYDPRSDSLLSYELFPVLDWELTDNGNFYYAIRPPEDRHYEFYTLIRTVPPDQSLWEMNEQYIMPIGYLATNMFLTDWSEDCWSDLSFNDLWEHLFRLENKQEFVPKDTDHIPQTVRYGILAAEFEPVILSYFSIDPDTLRELAYYQWADDRYLWQPIDAYDFAYIDGYACKPEVKSAYFHPDGTITLTVDALSTDLKCDSLFTHEVTVRPLENGRFQYVSNRVIAQSEYGLPYCAPRLTWEAP